MSSISASTVPAKAIISVRRGSLAAFAAAGLLVAIGAGLLLATSGHLVDPTTFGLTVAVSVVGWFSAALYWLVRRPGNRLGLFLRRGRGLHRPYSRFRERPSSSSTASVCSADWLFVRSRVSTSSSPAPEGRIAESRRMGAARRDGARTTWSRTSLTLLFSPVIEWQFPAVAGCNAACPANSLHDRRSADDRRRSFQQRYLRPT